MQLGSTAVLARLLAPGDFGIVALAIAVTGVAELLRDLGLSSATVQRREITQAQVSALAWIQISVGLACFAVVWFAAPGLADFFKQPALDPVLHVCSATFVLNALLAQPQALLQRRMAFRYLSVVDVATFATGVVAAVTGALLGLGYWALVAQLVVQPLARLALVLPVARWRPSRPGRARGLGPMLGFGAKLTLFQLLNYASRSVDNLIVGRLFGVAQLGYYDRAYGLLMLPIRQIQGPLTQVAVPTLSRLQDDGPRYRTYFCTLIKGLSWTLVPGLATAAVLAQPLVRILLGEQWAASAQLFQVFAIAGLLTVVSYANGWLYVSTGHTGRQALWGLISRPLIVLSFFAGAAWGPIGVASGFVLMSVVLTPFGFWNACAGTSVSVRDIVAASWRGYAVTAAAVAVTALVLRALGETPPTLVQIGAGLATTIVAGMLALLVVPGARSELFDLAGTVRKALRGSR